MVPEKAAMEEANEKRNVEPDLTERARRLGFSMKLSDKDERYRLVFDQLEELEKQDWPVYKFWLLEDIEAFLLEEEARPQTSTFWSVDIEGSPPGVPHETRIYETVVEVRPVRDDRVQGALARDEAIAFVRKNCGVTISSSNKKPLAKTSGPTQHRSGETPNLRYPIWVVKCK